MFSVYNYSSLQNFYTFQVIFFAVPVLASTLAIANRMVAKNVFQRDSLYYF